MMEQGFARSRGVGTAEPGAHQEQIRQPRGVARFFPRNLEESSCLIVCSPASCSPACCRWV